ncbi:MAG: tetratricopeptide repeat-containing sensor histidine kinase [Bacteroidetes bacterium]|nr:tetratricopeptide repeat-containing sensor histidine kinase [Bacteroidota bacterium]
MKLPIKIIVLVLVTHAGLVSARKDADSLIHCLKNARTDTSRIHYCLELGSLYQKVSTDTAILFFNEALRYSCAFQNSGQNEATTGRLLLQHAKALSSLAAAFGYYLNDHDTAVSFADSAIGIYQRIIKTADSRFTAAAMTDLSGCYNTLGIIYWNTGDYALAVNYYKKALTIDEKTGNLQAMSDCFNNIGLIYNDMGDYLQATEYFRKAVTKYEESDDRMGMSISLHNLGMVQKELGNYSIAVEYYSKAVAFFEEAGYAHAIGTCYNNIGNVYMEQGDYPHAIEYYNKSLKISEDQDYRQGMSNCYTNIGSVYDAQGKFSEAIDYYLKSLAIDTEIGDKQGMAAVNNCIADSYNKSGAYNNAIEYGRIGLNTALEIGSLDDQRYAYYIISSAYEHLGNTEEAYRYFRLFSAAKDSLFNIEKNNQITEMETKYRSEQKQKEIELLNKDKELQQAEIERKKSEVKKKDFERNAFIAGFSIVFFLAFIIYRGYRRKRKSNIALNEKNILISEQKEELEQTLEELKATQEQLIESEKMASLGSLVTGVAHEINTPVGIGITASSALVEDTRQFAEIYKSGKMSRKELEEYLDNIYQTGSLILKNMNRTGELVQNFKQVSVDQQSDQEREFNLLSYFNDIIRSLMPELEKKKIAVQIDCAEDVEINSYPGIFAQIIANLILNSIRHGFCDSDTGEVNIIANVDTPCDSTVFSNRHACLHLQFQDNGCGIPPENLPKIFDPFFTTDKQIGPGLGLYIVYNLVTQKLKGTIACESTEGNGVKFTISAPLK